MPNSESGLPNFSRIAAVIADPTRARMLAALLCGEYRSAGELATVAGITPQAASTQLAQLVGAGLVAVRQQGRHKYFALADAEVAHALEALALVAARDGVSARWERPAYQPLKCARRCYGHMAGELGVAQFDMLVRCGYLYEPAQNPLGHSGPGKGGASRPGGPPGLQLSNAGSMWVARLGVTLPNKKDSRFAYRCMDWSERKDHLAGTLARALLAHYLARNWLRAAPGARALSLTPQGQLELMPMLNEKMP
jgi:DNA-binding transcriptional ArsR family regulator